MAGGPYIVTRGIVLRDTDTRDADKILTLLTAEQGKIAVIARGARRKGCKFAACAQPLAYSEWTLYKKGQWYYANEGATLELFNGLRPELDAMALGFYLSELTEGVITEESPQQELLSHLLNGLYAISTLHKPLPLVKAAFELRLLCLAGYEPGGCLRLLRTAGPGAALLRCSTGGAPLPGLRRAGREVHAPVPGFPDGPAPHCLRRSQAAVLLYSGAGRPEAAVRGGGGLCLRPAGAGVPDPGFLQERVRNAAEIEYKL